MFIPYYQLCCILYCRYMWTYLEVDNILGDMKNKTFNLYWDAWLLGQSKIGSQQSIYRYNQEKYSLRWNSLIYRVVFQFLQTCIILAPLNCCFLMTIYRFVVMACGSVKQKHTKGIFFLSCNLAWTWFDFLLWLRIVLNHLSAKSIFGALMHFLQVFIDSERFICCHQPRMHDAPSWIWFPCGKCGFCGDVQRAWN